MAIGLKDTLLPRHTKALAYFTTLALTGQAAAQERPLFPPPAAIPAQDTTPLQPQTSSEGRANDASELLENQRETLARMRAFWRQHRASQESMRQAAQQEYAQESAAVARSHQTRLAAEDAQFSEKQSAPGALGEARRRLSMPTLAERVDAMFRDPDLQPHPTNGLSRIKEGLAAVKARADQADRDEKSTLVTVASIVATCYGGPVAGAAVRAAGDVIIDGKLGLGSAVSLGTAIANGSNSPSSPAAKQSSEPKGTVLPGTPVVAAQHPISSLPQNRLQQPFLPPELRLDLNKLVVSEPYGPNPAPLDSLIFPPGTNDAQRDIATALVRQQGLNYDGSGALPAKPEALSLLLGESSPALDGITYGNYQGIGGLDSTSRMSFQMAEDGTLLTRLSSQQFKERFNYTTPFNFSLDPFGSPGGFDGAVGFDGGQTLFSAGMTGPQLTECWGSIYSNGTFRENCGKLSLIDAGASLGTGLGSAGFSLYLKGPQLSWETKFLTADREDNGYIRLSGGKVGAALGPQLSIGAEIGSGLKPGLSWFSGEVGIQETRIDPTELSDDALKDIRWQNLPLPKLQRRVND